MQLHYAHSLDNPEEVYGHALMATSPFVPYQQSSAAAGSADNTYGETAIPTTEGDERTQSITNVVELGPSRLATLMELSKQFDLDGEVTPVMAWGMILSHPRRAEITPADIVSIQAYLSGKVRCHG